MIVLQSMKQKNCYLGIAEKVYPELKAGRFFTEIMGTEYYFSGLSNTEVKCVYRSFYDEFDYAFSIQYTFSLCDKKSETRWVRQEGSEHFYATPVLYVVERNELNFLPERIICRMKNYYRANTLLLRSYKHTHCSLKQFKELMKENGLHLIFHNDLENVNASGQSGIIPQPSSKQCETSSL